MFWMKTKICAAITQLTLRFLGSMADVPKDMLQQIAKLEEIFTVPKEKLKEISDHFVSELTKG